jgi:tetratricopeptide (TPR) repeat protein
MVHTIKKICWFCCAVLLFVMCSAQAGAVENDTSAENLMQASRAYKEGRYAEAVGYYEQIASAGATSGRLFYNLGNAYMRSGQPGLALLNYRRAELRIPRNEDLHYNIAFARSQARDSIECSGYAEALKDICFWYTRMSTTEIIWTACILNAVFWLLLLIRFFYRREGLSIVLAIVLFLTIVFAASAAVKHYSIVSAPSGVVTVSEISVRSGTSLNDTVLFKLHEAAEFICEEERDTWVLIRLCDGKKGWVQAGLIAKVE